jgi:hypothetical protein
MSETRDYRGLRFQTRRMRDGRIHFLVERISDGHILDSWPYRAESVTGIDQLMSDWIDERIGVHEPATIHCSACGCRLASVGRQDTEYQFDNAIWISFSGGYGMFVDPLGKEDPKGVLCHDCAHRLCEQNPWVNALLRPFVSHSHPSAQTAALIAAGHQGWDLLPANFDDGAELRSHLRDVHHVEDLPDDDRALWACHYEIHIEQGNDHQH